MKCVLRYIRAAVRRSNGVVAVGLLGAAILFAAGITGEREVQAQAKKKPAGKAAAKPSAKTAKSEDEPELSQADILGKADPNAPAGQDVDQTPAGQTRLAAVLEKSKGLIGERGNLVVEHKKLREPRDTLLVEINGLEVGKQQLSLEIDRLEGEIRKNNSQILFSKDQQLINDLTTRNARFAAQQETHRTQIATNNREIGTRAQRVLELNNQIRPIAERLLAIWKELEFHRQDWAAIRQPVEKYARGEFEQLRVAIDEWVVADEYWPEAYVWAALCAVELKNYQLATSYYKKAAEVRAQLWGTKKPWPPLVALNALIQYGDQKTKTAAATDARRASNILDRKRDWQTNFILGRCYADRDSESGKSRSYFEKALEIEPSARCATLWLGRMQTQTTNEKARDLEAGTKLLEQLWVDTGKRSWRQALYLAQAYTAAGKAADATPLWDRAFELAPPENRREVEEARKVETLLFQSP
jgi:tetratricopeptide (TPR) repeat protein